MTAQQAVNDAFARLGAETTIWRKDDNATHRIGSVAYTAMWGVRKYATVYVSDHRQGRYGQRVTIGQANPQDLDVRVSTDRRLVDKLHVRADDLYDTITKALDEAK